MLLGSKREGEGARFSTAVCLSSLWPQDQGKLVQTVGPFPGAQDFLLILTCKCQKNDIRDVGSTADFLAFLLLMLLMMLMLLMH